MSNNKAFSLIELLIVMAIVGVLAAIAVPAYQSYQTRAKIATGMTIMNAQVSKVIQYFSRNNQFPTSAQLGLSSGVMPSDPANYLFPPYVAYMYITTYANYGTCQYAVVSMNLSNINSAPTNLSTVGKVIRVNVDLFDVNGVMEQLCTISGEDYDNGGAQLPSYGVSNCYNMVDQGTEYSDAYMALLAKCNP